MKANKAGKRLAKIEALLSNVIERYSASGSVRDLLHEAKASIIRAKKAMSEQASPEVTKNVAKAQKAGVAAQVKTAKPAVAKKTTRPAVAKKVARKKAAVKVAAQTAGKALKKTATNKPPNAMAKVDKAPAQAVATNGAPKKAITKQMEAAGQPSES